MENDLEAKLQGYIKLVVLEKRSPYVSVGLEELSPVDSPHKMGALLYSLGWVLVEKADLKDLLDNGVDLLAVNYYENKDDGSMTGIDLARACVFAVNSREATIGCTIEHDGGSRYMIEGLPADAGMYFRMAPIVSRVFYRRKEA